MRSKILAIAAGVFGAWACIAWAVIFLKIIQGGGITLIEPVRWVIKAEFGLAVFFTFINLAWVLAAIRK